MRLERPKGDIWVFGYGSLIWRPNFPHKDAQAALLRGYHRAPCIYSTNYRGTCEQPGLVLGLDRGGACRGLAFHVADRDADAVIDYLYAREMINRVYRPRWTPVALQTGSVTALIFVADREHEQYAGKLSDEDALKLILQGCGKQGRCIDYFRNTLAHLDSLGIHDRTLTRIVGLVESKAGI